MAPLDKTGLVQAARSGDELAFDSLIGPLIDPAYKLAVVFLRNPDDAQDAVQDSTLKAWRSLDRLRSDAAVRPWFLTIVANHCRSVRRSRWWSVIRLESITQADQGIGERELQLDLDRELSRLSATDRASLFLFFYLDLPLSDVARILKISPHAASHGCIAL